MLRPLDSRGQPLDLIRIAGLRAACIVGVYAEERLQPQELELEVALHLDTRRAAAEGRIRDTVDYARLAGELRFLLQAARFPLLETAADGLCRYLLAPPVEDAPRTPVEAATVRISKLRARDAVGGEPSIEIHRRAVDCLPTAEAHGRELLQRAAGGTLLRLRVPAGGSLALTAETGPLEDLALSDGLRVDGQPLPAGTGLRWHAGPEGRARYENPGPTPVTLLRVQRAMVGVAEASDGPSGPAGAIAYYPRQAVLAP